MPLAQRPTRIALCFLLAASASLVAQLPSSVPNTREEAARLLGVAPTDLASFDVATRHFPYLNLKVTMAKGDHVVTGETLSVIQDASGVQYNFAQLRAAEAAARLSAPDGKFHHKLKKAVEASPDSVLPAIAWLHFDAVGYDAFANAVRESVDVAKLTIDEARALEQRITDHVMAQNALVTRPFAGTLSALGLRIRYISTTAPVVFFDADVATLRSLAERPEVDTLYLETADKSDTNDDANSTHRTDRVHNYGIRGRGSRVALLEDNGIDPACPHLVISGWFNPGTPDPDDHIHGTTGCVASRLTSRLGAAPDAEIFSANATTYSDANVTAAGDWVVTQNIDITNLSWGPNSPTGVPDYSDRYFDYQSRAFQDSYVASAGNAGLANFVGNTGWNVIAVGSHTDGGNSNWDDDVMSTFSSAANPNTGCEKPNIAANGQDVDTLGQGPDWLTDDYDGTSFSSPHAAGNLANAVSQNAFLAVYPDAAMAAIMASAWHNIEGASRLSGQDGAGGLHGLALVRLAIDGRATGTSLTPASFTTTGYYTYSIFLKSGDRTRVCAAWQSLANATYTTDTLQADLDITILAGQNVTSGTSYGSSASFNNNFEIVEFTPPTTGWYTVRVNDYSFTGTSETLGIAWSQKYEDTSHFRLRPWNSETNPIGGPTMGNASYYLDPVAPSSPSAPYVVLPSGTITVGFNFSDQTFSPLDFDIWTQLFFDTLPSPIFWPGSIGTLGASGSGFSNRFTVPDAPFLIGLNLYHVGFTGGPTYPDALKEISEVNTLKFWPAPIGKTLSDDGSFTQALPFGFQFFGTNYTQCHVNANGNITFNTSDGTFGESQAGFLANQPRIAAMWDDLNPGVNGSSGAPILRVREVFQGNQEVVIEFINVTQFALVDDSTFRVTLSDDNSITIEYLDCSVQDCIVGISPGGGVSAAAPVDLSSFGRGTSGTNQALYEVFGATPGLDLDSPNIYWNKIRFVPTSGTATNYRLELDIDR